MPADLAISPSSPKAPAAFSQESLTQAPLTRALLGNTNAQNAVKSVATAPSAPVPMQPNPAMHIDPELGLVVIEYHDTEGKLTGSLPTPRQLDAYRMTMQVPPNAQATPAAADQTAAAELAATV